MRPLTNNCRLRRTEHLFYVQIVTDITTRNSVRELNNLNISVRNLDTLSKYIKIIRRSNPRDTIPMV